MIAFGSTPRLAVNSILWFFAMNVFAWVPNIFLRTQPVSSTLTFAILGFAWGLTFSGVWVALSPGRWPLTLSIGLISFASSCQLIAGATAFSIVREFLVVGIFAGVSFTGLWVSKIPFWNLGRAFEPSVRRFSIRSLMLLTLAIAIWLGIAKRFDWQDMSLNIRVFIIAITAMAGLWIVHVELFTRSWVVGSFWGAISCFIWGALLTAFLFFQDSKMQNRDLDTFRQFVLESDELTDFTCFIAAYFVTITMTTMIGRIDARSSPKAGQDSACEHE